MTIAIFEQTYFVSNVKKKENLITLITFSFIFKIYITLLLVKLI